MDFTGIGIDVRRADPDRYLAVLYAPHEVREALLALYAFNIEIASIRDRVKESQLGEIRLQWWRDMLQERIRGQRVGYPIAEKIHQVMEQFGLPLPLFLDMIDARRFDLYDDPMPTRGALESYCVRTAASLIRLCALILNREEAKYIEEITRHAGCAQATAGLLRLLPLHLFRGQCYMPLDLLSAVGTTREAFLLGENKESEMRAALALAALGYEHLSIFEGLASTLPASLRPAFLPLALTRAYLARVQSGSNPFGGVMPLSPIRRHGLLFRRALRGW